MTKKELLDRCAGSGEERLLLARVLDKLELSEKRGIPAHTGFLSPGEQALVAQLLSAAGRPRHEFWGGWPESERKICLFPAPWQEEGEMLQDPEGPLAGLEGSFPPEAGLSHRDILGALMGLGMTREVLGDILLPRPGLCQVVVLRGSAPVLLSQWESAGRWKLRLELIPLDRLTPVPPQVKTLRDTVAALRLDAVLAAGFSMSRSKAADLIAGGRVAVNHRECLKPDRQAAQGDVITCRGLGKFVVKEVLGQSKKGRTMVVLERYL